MLICRNEGEAGQVCIRTQPCENTPLILLLVVFIFSGQFGS